MNKIDMKDLIAKYNDKEELYEIYKDGKFVGYLNDPLAIKEVMVKDIINEKETYFIPDFQRGYRWDKDQVLDLLNDINEWNPSDESLERYCLQPIVLKRVDNKYHVIDGQQRLTTLYIILKAIDESVSYTIEYQTRENSSKFLDELNEEEANSNIDYYYMYQAYETTIDYFKKRDKNKWYQKLRNDLTGAFFIKYEVFDQDGRDVEEIFNNLNAGKVRLTDSELIKAYLLSNIEDNNKNNKELEISFEWDRIERKLQDDNFWAWLGQKKISGPRINYLFKLQANLLKYNLSGRNKNKYKLDEKINSYRTLVENVSDKKDVVDFFQKSKETFMRIEDWYEDYETYHLIGYFNNVINRNNYDTSIFKMLKDSNHNKINFRSEVEKFILSDKVNNNNRSIQYERYDYLENADDTYNVLLLFNIITSINSMEKFNFSAYSKTIGKSKRYEIEHIFPQTDNDLTKNEIKDIINNLKSQISSLSLTQGNLKSMINNLNEYNFKEEYEKIVYDGTNSSIQNVNGLGNLCLLDSSTNSSIKNHPFIFKLHYIIKETQSNKNYILPATKNVFLKYYSNLSVDNLIWSNEDEDSYFEKIKDAINNFFKDKGVI